MASIHRCKGSQFFYVAFRDKSGNQHFRSTKTTDRDEALKMAEVFGAAAREIRVATHKPEILARRIDQVIEAIQAGPYPKPKRAPTLTPIPRRTSAKPEPGVYILYDGQFSRIGSSRNVRNRVASQLCDYPKTLELFHYWPTQFLYFENQLHHVLKKFRVSPSWFELPLSVLEKLLLLRSHMDFTLLKLEDEQQPV